MLRARHAEPELATGLGQIEVSHPRVSLAGVADPDAGAQRQAEQLEAPARSGLRPGAAVVDRLPDEEPFEGCARGIEHPSAPDRRRLHAQAREAARPRVEGVRLRAAGDDPQIPVLGIDVLEARPAPSVGARDAHVGRVAAAQVPAHLRADERPIERVEHEHLVRAPRLEAHARLEVTAQRGDRRVAGRLDVQPGLGPGRDVAARREIIEPQAHPTLRVSEHAARRPPLARQRMGRLEDRGQARPGYRRAGVGVEHAGHRHARPPLPIDGHDAREEQLRVPRLLAGRDVLGGGEQGQEGERGVLDHGRGRAPSAALPPLSLPDRPATTQASRSRPSLRAPDARERGGG